MPAIIAIQIRRGIWIKAAVALAVLDHLHLLVTAVVIQNQQTNQRATSLLWQNGDGFLDLVVFLFQPILVILVIWKHGLTHHLMQRKWVHFKIKTIYYSREKLTLSIHLRWYNILRMSLRNVFGAHIGQALILDWKPAIQIHL